MSEIASRVKEIIVEQLGVDENTVTETATFADLGADSLDTVDIIMKFEKEFNVKIAEEESEKIKTVGDAIAHLEELTSK